MSDELPISDRDGMELFKAAYRTALQHRIKLGFKCRKCGQDVYKTMQPATEHLPFTMWSVGCQCGSVSYTEDVEIDPERWPLF